MKIETLLIECLDQKGRVQLPGWGSFYLKSQDARWDSFTGTAFPAGKYIGFNPAIARTENTLLPTVMRSMGTTMEVAEQWISRKINGWQQVLDQGQVLMLPNIGSFSTTAGFKPEHNVWSDDSFGLTPFMMHAVHEPSALQSKVSASLKLVTERREKGLKDWQKAAVAAAVTALFGLGIFQSELPTEMAGWIGSSSANSSAVSVESSEETQLEVNTLEEAEEISTEKVAETMIEKAAVVSQPVKGLGYYIVVGSFKEAANADSFSAELAAQGYHVSILPGSLKKVGIGHFTSRDAAKAELVHVKSAINSHAWIFAY
jgi:cell division septation protein DedD/nucleoid DNA-binding protein